MTRHWVRCSLLGAAALAAGCKTAPPPAPVAAAPSPAMQTLLNGEHFKVYTPATRPADPVTDAFPTAPQDARPGVPLRYTVEIWEIMLPRDSVSRDETFWKRVDEPSTPEGQQLLKNGIRTGEMPISDMPTVQKLIEDRGGTHTTYNGVIGRGVEIPIKSNVLEQTLFCHDRNDELVGRSWEHCDDLFYFSFETTPRNPDKMRIALTPGVRSKERKMVYATVAGRDDREIQFVSEQSQYDATVSADLSLDRMLVIAPSDEAREPHTIGGTFLINNAVSQQQERFILIIPHAFTFDDATSPVAAKAP